MSTDIPRTLKDGRLGEPTISRPNSAPAYYQGRPADLLIKALSPRRERTASSHPAQAVTSRQGERHHGTATSAGVAA